MKKKRILLIAMAISFLWTFTACTGKQEQGDEIADAINETVTKKEQTVQVTGIDLYGTYDQNDLFISTLKEEQESVTLKIPQIGGLKDKKVQDKINQDLHARAKELYDSFETVEYSSYYTSANFANVLSLSIFAGHEDRSQQIYINYNLVDGENLDFEELFLEDTDILQIVRKAFYEMLVKDQIFEGVWDEVVSPDENKLYKIVKSYMNEEEKAFSFTPSEILLYTENSAASIKMQDIADEIGIYSRYLTKESIFERDDIGRKDIFTCASLPEDTFKIFDFGYLEENLWYDVTVWQDYLDELDSERLEKYRSFEKSIYDGIYKKLDEYKKIVKQNQHRFYIFMAKPSVSIEMNSEFADGSWSDTYFDTAWVNEHIQTFEMPMETYETIYKDKIIEAYRYKYLAMAGGAMLDTEVEEGVEFTESGDGVKYNYMTGEQVAE